jgi:hypothetical protein
MYRIFKNAPYYMWTVMSILCQVRTAPRALTWQARSAAGASSLADTMLLPLAVRMLQKAQADKFLGREGLRLYLLVLREQRNYGAALALLKDDAGTPPA